MPKVKKEETPVLAYTAQYIIRGKAFTPPGGRLLDFMSGMGQKRFIPVTDAVITDLSGREICRTDFMVLNKEEIVFIIPQDK